jgi:hypothetical protein
MFDKVKYEGATAPSRGLAHQENENDYEKENDGAGFASPLSVKFSLLSDHPLR